MKRLEICLTACFIFLSAIGNSQVNANKIPGLPLKGYHNIHQNSRKLTSGKSFETGIDTNAVIMRKGYFSIGRNNGKLKGKAKPRQKVNEPRVSKGYYSIGTNNEKLHVH